MKAFRRSSQMTKSFGLIALVALGACGGAVRTAEPYRDDVAKVLATKNADVKACYDKLLVGKKDLAGKVTVKFAVEMKTGAFKDVKTDGPAELGACVSGAMTGLVLDPGDINNGDATFEYEFTVGAPAAS